MRVRYGDNCDLGSVLVYLPAPTIDYDGISIFHGPKGPPARAVPWMPRVRFIQPDGSASEVDALSGDSIMETAIDNDIDGIVAECGGACSCATCHVYVQDEWLGKLPPPDALEDGMLDCVIDRRPNSRLSCQLRVGDEIDGITVQVPQSQI